MYFHHPECGHSGSVSEYNRIHPRTILYCGGGGGPSAVRTAFVGRGSPPCAVRNNVRKPKEIPSPPMRMRTPKPSFLGIKNSAIRQGPDEEATWTERCVRVTSSSGSRLFALFSIPKYLPTRPSLNFSRFPPKRAPKKYHCQWRRLRHRR
ncbi:unnamed protein product [Ixodes persulcatus]